MNFIKKIALLLIVVCISANSYASYLLIQMDDSQKNHLKAYGIAFWVLNQNVEVSWLLNYRGGSFLIKHLQPIEDQCIIRGVSYEIIANAQAAAIQQEIANPEVNMDVVKLEKPPKIVVYSPKSKLPWDDAVTLVLSYAEIPYDVIYDEEIINGQLPLYDWLHLHHEDFTGQYGKFYSMYKNAPWYREQVRASEEMAAKLGFEKVSELKLAVATSIRNFTAVEGSYLPCARVQTLMILHYQLKELTFVKTCTTMMV